MTLDIPPRISLDEVNARLAPLGEALGVFFLGIAGPEGCPLLLRTDSPITVYWPQDSFAVLLLARLEEFDVDNPGVLDLALRANARPDATLGGYFALDESGDQLLFGRVLPLQGDTEALAQEVRNFQALVTDWQQELNLQQDLDPDDIDDYRLYREEDELL